IQFGWALQLSLLTPYVQTLGIPHVWASFVWLCGPISGLLVQPLVGVWSDSCRSPWGRRRPFIFTGALLVMAAVLIIGFSADLGYLLGDELHPQGGTRPIACALFVFGFWCLDLSNNTVQAPARALVADLTAPSSQLEAANAWYSFWMAHAASYSILLLARYLIYQTFLRLLSSSCTCLFSLSCQPQQSAGSSQRVVLLLDGRGQRDGLLYRRHRPMMVPRAHQRCLWGALWFPVLTSDACGEPCANLKAAFLLAIVVLSVCTFITMRSAKEQPLTPIPSPASSPTLSLTSIHHSALPSDIGESEPATGIHGGSGGSGGGGSKGFGNGVGLVGSGHKSSAGASSSAAAGAAGAAGAAAGAAAFCDSSSQAAAYETGEAAIVRGTEADHFTTVDLNSYPNSPGSLDPADLASLPAATAGGAAATRTAADASPEEPVIEEYIGSISLNRSTNRVDLLVGIRLMPKSMWLVLSVMALTWMAWFPFFLFDTDWMGREVYRGEPSSADPAAVVRYQAGVRDGALGLLLFSMVQALTAFSLDPICIRFGPALPSTALRAAALSVFALAGASFAITGVVPYSITADQTAGSGAGQGLSMGILNLAIVCPQILVSLGAGPWDALFGGGNVPAFVLGALFAVSAAVLSAARLSKLPRSTASTGLRRELPMH
ncbi:unnamed protein product, partial [Closterium sp. Yama58-4]